MATMDENKLRLSKELSKLIKLSKQEKWCIEKYNMEMILFHYKNNYNNLFMKCIPIKFMSCINFLRKLNLIIINHQNTNQFVKRNDNKGYNINITYNNKFKLLDYVIGLKQNNIYIPEDIIINKYNSIINDANKYMYGMIVNTNNKHRGKDKFGGLKPTLERISLHFNAPQFKDSNKLKKCVVLFILDNKLASKNELKMWYKQINFRLLPIGLFENTNKNNNNKQINKANGRNKRNETSTDKNNNNNKSRSRSRSRLSNNNNNKNNNNNNNNKNEIDKLKQRIKILENEKTELKNENKELQNEKREWIPFQHRPLKF